MSFNLRTATIFDLHNHWNFRRDRVADTIRRFDPDVIGTQECQTTHAEYVRTRLPQYQFFGAGRSDGKSRGEMCAVFYRDAVLEKLDGGHFWLSTTPEKPGSKSWGSWFVRMATWVKLRHRSTGQVMFVFNTHLDSNSASARARQAKLLRETIQSIAGQGMVILTGDFNTGEASTPYETLVGPAADSALTLLDSFRAVHPTRTSREGTHHGFSGKVGGDRIDWILASPLLVPTAATIDHASIQGGSASDHYPVTATFSVASPATAAHTGGPSPAPAGDGPRAAGG